MLQFFRTTRPAALFTTVAIAIALWAQSLISAMSITTAPTTHGEATMPLYALTLRLLESETSIWSILLSLALTITMGFYMLAINTRHIIIKQRSSYVPLMLVLIASALATAQRLNPAVLAALTLLRAFDHLLSIYPSNKPLDAIFRAGLNIGVATLFYAPAAAFALLLPIALLSMRPFFVREWIAAIIGLLLPTGIHALVLFLTDHPVADAWNRLIVGLNTHSSTAYPNLHTQIAMGVGLGLPTAVALLFTLRRAPMLKINVKKALSTNIWMLLICIACFAIIPNVSFEMLYIIALPLALPLANLFVHIRSAFWGNLLLAFLLIGAAASQLLPLMLHPLAQGQP